jgi:hypothetical protein
MLNVPETSLPTRHDRLARNPLTMMESRNGAQSQRFPEASAFRFDSAGLPPDFLPVYADTRGAFVPKGDQIVAHGGASVEELIVPFAKITMTRTAT